MKKTIKVTLLGVCVLALVSLFTTVSLAAPAKPNKVVMSVDQHEKEIESSAPLFSGDLQISRGTSLYDHQDGTRKDSVDYLFVPNLKTSIGSFKAKIAYSQDLKEESTYSTDWADTALIYSMNASKWKWAQPYIISFTPYFTAVVPTSQVSIKKDELKTALSAGISFGILPDGLAAIHDGAWSLALAITAGQNIHSYSTDINGKVLNKYSSNQILNLGYSIKDFTVGLEFINKSRWSYEGNSKNTFIHSEELGYSISEHFNTAIGHTNEGSSLRANGTDSNLDLINENDSTVYAQIGISF